MTNTADTTTCVGLTIFAQIPRMLRVRLGWRESRFHEKGITARITANQSVLLEIILDEATDLYRITTYRIVRFIRQDRKVWDQVDAEQMVMLLDLIDRGEVKA